MSITEPVGYLASALVLATFSMRDMGALRWMAIASNLAFIAYGALADLGPVLVLHLLLLPLNLARLREAGVAARQHTPTNTLGPVGDAVGAAAIGIGTHGEPTSDAAPGRGGPERSWLDHGGACVCADIPARPERRKAHGQV